MQKNQDATGFTAPETIIAVLLLIIIVLTGIYVFHARNVKPLHVNQNESDQQTSASMRHTVYQGMLYGKLPVAVTLQLPGGEAKIISVFYGTYFDGVSFAYPTVTVDMSLINNSTVAQTYDLTYFSVELPSGEVVASTGPFNKSIDSSKKVMVPVKGADDEFIAFSPIQGKESAGTGYVLYNTSPPNTGSGDTTISGAIGTGYDSGSATTTQASNNPMIFKVPVTFKTPSPLFE